MLLTINNEIKSFNNYLNISNCQTQLPRIYIYYICTDTHIFQNKNPLIYLRKMVYKGFQLI